MYKNIFLLSIIFFLLNTLECRPVDEEEEDEFKEAKKISDDEVKEVVNDLESLISKIPIEHFIGDTKLKQVIDSINDVTSYKANGTKKEPPIYERQSNDKDKKSIVLLPSEDKVTVRKEKKTYIGLRHSGEEKEYYDEYYVFYIYLRDGGEGEEGVKKVGGVDKFVEYDSWENREDKLQKVNNGFGFSECSSSIFIPCKTNESSGFAKQRIDHRPKDKHIKDEKKEDTKKYEKPKPKPEGTFKTEDGFDADENVDFFFDMENDIQKARFIGIGLDLMGEAGGLGGIGNVLSGVFGGVANGFGGLLSGVMNTASSLVGGVVQGGVGAVSGIVNAATGLISGTLGSLLNIGGGGEGGGGFGGILNVGIDLGKNMLGGFTNMISGGLKMGTEMLSNVINMGTQMVSGLVNTGMGMAQGVVGMGANLLGAGINMAGGMIGMHGMGDMVSGTINAGMSMATGMVGAATNVIGGIANAITNMVSGVLQAGIGVVNSLLSFGGLGSSKATADSVGLSVGINLGLGGEVMSNQDFEEVQQGLQSPESGGLGGLVGLDLEIEVETTEATQSGRGIHGSNQPTLSPDQKELAEAERQGRALVTLKLAEILSKKMGENLGKEMLKTGLLDHPGWKTMDEGGGPGNTISHEDDAFVGFGGCEYHKVNKKDYENAKDSNSVLKVLMTALRTQCVNKELKFYQQLINDKFIHFKDDDKIFEISKDNKFVKSDKLSPKRRSELSRAVELCAFSKIFKEEIESENPHSAPKGSSVTRRVFVLGQTVLEAIELTHKEHKSHEIKILRSLLATVKAAFTKLVQDHDVTKGCDSCEDELNINKEDQKYLMTIMEFIMHGLSPVQKKSTPVKTALDTFNTTNSDTINNRVNNYLL